MWNAEYQYSKRSAALFMPLRRVGTDTDTDNERGTDT